jgi:outer membrane protein assembly complex protein YaeT
MKAMDRFPRSTRRLAVVVAVCLVSAAVSLAQTGPGKVTVADVIVPPGNYQLPMAKIFSLVKTRAGSDFSQGILDDDVRELYQTKAFANVFAEVRHPEDGKVVIVFHLTPLPSTVQKIEYEGNKHMSKDDLDSATGLHKGMPLNPTANQTACQAIEHKYREKGRMFVKVELLEGNKAGDTTVRFRITEGPKIKVRSTTFVGCTFVSAGRLRTQIHTSRAFLHLLGGDYDEEEVKSDVADLIKYYRSFGYHDVVVTRELAWSEDQRYVDITFHIHEGQRYRVSLVDIAGNKAESPDKLESVVHLKMGDYYSNGVVQADVKNLRDVYGYDGRDATVKEEQVFTPNGVPGEVAVHYEIQEKQPATVGQIFIVGNDVTKQNVILRQVPLYPGQLLTYPDLDKAQAQLSRLNIFESDPQKGIRPTVEVLNPDSDDPVKDILIHVQETRTGSLLFGVGVNSDAGLTGSIVLNERNFDITKWPSSWDELMSGQAFRGAGQEFRIEAVPGTQLQRYTVSWREPYLFDTQYSLADSYYYYDRSYNEDLESRLGTRITVGKRLNDYWSILGSVRLENVAIHDVVDFAPIDYQSVLGNNFAAGFRVGFSRDTRDSFLRPTSGNILEVGYEQVTGTYTYPLATLSASQFFTVYQRADGSGRHVLALRTIVGWAGDNTPVYDRYYAGGFQSLRGFAFRGVGPNINGFEVGGDFQWLNSAEYQIPVLANDQLYFVAFLDSGTVESNVQITNYRVAAGAGMRIVVPMLGPVPIALDFGYPIVQAAGDQKQVFSFWLGFFH